MTIRIAFTSCSDPMDEPQQTVWDLIASQRPDHLVLLGDQVYMDYAFLWLSKNPSLGKPAKMANIVFAASMHERYRRQWEIMRVSQLAALPELKIHGIWDDHDFAWNNSYGNGATNTSHLPGKSGDPVPCDKQQIARHLMRDFFSALHSLGASYPANPFTSNVVNPTANLAKPMYFVSPRGNTSGAKVLLAADAKLLLTDGRTFRTQQDVNKGTVFGGNQWSWLKSEVDGTHVVLLACSTTLDKGGEHLNKYQDYQTLISWAGQQQARVLCLTGDVHKNDWRRHGGRVYEAVASGAARTRFGQYGAYGTVEITDQRVTVQLFVNSTTPKITRSVERDTWKEV